VLLDTNLWGYLVDVGAAQELRKASKRSNVEIVACPAVAYELLRDGDPDRRRAKARAITLSAWVRSMPEVYQESMEVLAAIRSHHPEWLSVGTDLSRFYKLKADWAGGAWWRRARRSPDSESQYIAQLGGDQLTDARAHARTQGREFRAAGITFEGVRLDSVRASFEVPPPGWDGEPFAAWRAECLIRWTEQVIRARNDTAERDWLGPWLDLNHVERDQANWLRFWTKEVDASALPLQWLRWAMAYVQSTRAVTAGTPGDNQITTYLPSCDRLVTADSAFADCVDRLREASPVRLAATTVTPAGQAGVAALIALIDDCRS
jgi:hypothetical protein